MDSISTRPPRSRSRPNSSQSSSIEANGSASPDFSELLSTRALSQRPVATFSTDLRRILVAGVCGGSSPVAPGIQVALANSPLTSSDQLPGGSVRTQVWSSALGLVKELARPLLADGNEQTHQLFRETCQVAFLAEVIARVASSPTSVRSWLAVWLAALMETEWFLQNHGFEASQDMMPRGDLMDRSFGEIEPQAALPTVRQLVIVLEEVGLYSVLPLPHARLVEQGPWNVAAAAFGLMAEFDAASQGPKLLASGVPNRCGETFTGRFLPAALPAGSRKLLLDRASRLAPECDRLTDILLNDVDRLA